MKHAAVAALAVVTLIGSRTVRADSESDHDDPDRKLGWEASFGFPMGTMQVGKWNPLEIGFEARGGVRLARFALLAELDYAALWGASWRHGSIDIDGGDEVQGSMLRGALVARYSFAQFVGDWHKGQRLTNSFYVEGELGEQAINVDREASFTRHDVGLGIGYLMDARLSRHGGHRMAGYYSFHVLYAPSANTPDPTRLGCVEACPGFPGTGSRDVGFTFDFGLAFGS